jgi:hypothetical protein
MPHRSSSAPMMCTACSSANEPGSVVCQACGANLARDGDAWDARPAASGGRNDALFADLERCLAEIAVRLRAIEAKRAAIVEVLARRETTGSNARPAKPAARRVQIGTLQLTIDGAEGARIETATSSSAGAMPPRRSEPNVDLPSVDVRPEAETAVWEALAHGASVVHIDGQPGAGATTLLQLLAAGARDHEFADGTLLLEDVRGPASDVAQQVAARFYDAKSPRYYTATELARNFGDVRALVLFDRAKLTADELAQLGDVFPTFRFVIAQAESLPHTPSIRLGPLHPDKVLTLLEQSFGRHIDVDNGRVAVELCAGLRSLPGPTRLIGIAARESQRSFISLQIQFETGEALIQALIASLAPAEQRVLSCMALARMPLSASALESIAESGETLEALKRLTRCELLRAVGTDLHAIPSYVERFIPRLTDADMVFERVVAAGCDAFDPGAPSPVVCRSASAEGLVKRPFERSQWQHVVALGLRLGDTFAVNGLFGAWGRVLELVEIAAARVEDPAALSRAKHDLSVRTELLGGLADAPAGRIDLHHASGTAASNTPPAGRSLPASDTMAPDGSSTAPIPYSDRGAAVCVSEKSLDIQTFLFCALGLVILAILAISLRNRPNQTPAITQFTSNPRSIAGGAAAQLCVNAADAAVVEVFPDAARLPGTGKHCLIVHPTATTTYIAVATSANGLQVHQAVTVRVKPRHVARRLLITAFSVSPARIKAGGSTRLCYAVTGAKLLRMVPRIGDLTRLRSCRPITLRNPHRYTFLLSAVDDNGKVAMRQVRVDVLPSMSRAQIAARYAWSEHLTRQAVYQFDATPSIVERGQATSLCVGVGRPARGFVTHIGSLTSGITRCYRVQPRSTTVYRLYVALQHSTALQMVTVSVRPPARRREVARVQTRR